MQPGDVADVDDVVTDRRARNVEPWRLYANCRGLPLAVFFAPEHEPIALAVCAVCSVRDECRAFADEAGMKAGVWGGVTEHARRRLMRSTSVVVLDEDGDKDVRRLANQLPAALEPSPVTRRRR